MDAVSHCAPGYRFLYHVPPKSPPFSMMRTPCTPASTIRAQVARPAKPPPMNANVTWSVLASRCATGVYGSYAKRPFGGVLRIAVRTQPLVALSPIFGEQSALVDLRLGLGARRG